MVKHPLIGRPAGKPWAVAMPEGKASVCATRVFRLRPGPVVRRFVQPAVVSSRRGASRGSPGVIRALWLRSPGLRRRRLHPGHCILAGQAVGKPWAVVVSEGKKHPFAPRGFPTLALPCGPAVCCSPPWLQAGVAQAGFWICHKFKRVRPLQVFWFGWRARYLPCPGPTRRSRGRGVALWPVSPEFRPPAPLSSGVGRIEERARARRAGKFADNFEPWLLCPVRQGCPVWPFAKSGRVAVSGFLIRWRVWLGCSIRRPIRLRHAVFPASAWGPWSGGLFNSSSPPGFRPSVAQAGVAPPPRPAFG